jgi:hypothetical protein
MCSSIIYTEKSDKPTPADASRRSSSSILSNNSDDLLKLDDILQLLTQLYSFSRNYLQSQPFRESINLDSYFQSKKLNNKLLKQMEDSIIIASSSFPSWSSWLTHSYRFFYPFESRQLYFRTTSFGTSRSSGYKNDAKK